MVNRKTGIVRKVLFMFLFVEYSDLTLPLEKIKSALLAREFIFKSKGSTVGQFGFGKSQCT